MSDENLNIKKPGQAPREGLRTGARAIGEMMAGVSEAFADAFKGFNDKLAKPTSQGLASGILEGVAEGNARFLERLAKASRETYQRTAAAAPLAIDYELLAKHVAKEMKKDKDE